MAIANVIMGSQHSDVGNLQNKALINLQNKSLMNIIVIYKIINLERVLIRQPHHPVNRKQVCET